MKKTILAVAIPALLFANASSAVELYSDADNTFSVGGHVGLNVGGSDEGETNVGSNSPRFNIEASRDLGEGVNVFIRSEWQTNLLEGGETSFTTRLGYLGVSHDKLGTGIIGTQWSPYYGVAGVADLPVLFANGSIYSDHYNLGTGRAEKMVSYSNSLDLGTAGELGLGLGWQGKHDESNTFVGVDQDTDPLLPVVKSTTAVYDDRMQVALSYSVMGATLGYAYNTGDVNYGAGTEEAVSNVVSAKYGAYGDGLYAGVSYADSEYMYSQLAETTATSAIVAYALPNSLNFSVNYETVEDDDLSQTLNETTAFQIEYKPVNNVITYVGYKVDLGNDLNDVEDDQWAIGARLYL
jgi:predicted porin